jgi:hypothetical protein
MRAFIDQPFSKMPEFAGLQHNEERPHILVVGTGDHNSSSPLYNKNLTYSIPSSKSRCFQSRVSASLCRDLVAMVRLLEGAPKHPLPDGQHVLRARLLVHVFEEGGALHALLAHPRYLRTSGETPN